MNKTFPSAGLTLTKCSWFLHYDSCVNSKDSNVSVPCVSCFIQTFIHLELFKGLIYNLYPSAISVLLMPISITNDIVKPYHRLKKKKPLHTEQIFIKISAVKNVSKWTTRTWILMLKNKQGHGDNHLFIQFILGKANSSLCTFSSCGEQRGRHWDDLNLE